MYKRYIIKKHYPRNKRKIALHVFIVGSLCCIMIFGIFLLSQNSLQSASAQTTAAPPLFTPTPTSPDQIQMQSEPSPTIQLPTASPTTQPTVTPTNTPIPTSTPTPTAAPPSGINTVQMKSAIQKIVNAHPELHLGVSYINLKDENRVDVNGADVFTAASTNKVFIACLLLSQVEIGKYSLSQPLDGATVGIHLQRMINQSNNDSWASLMKFIGIQYQAPYAQSLGITSYNFQNNTISPNDMALLLYDLYTGKLLTPSDTLLLLTYMQHTNMEDLIPPAVPDGVNVYHKYGNITTYLHDAAIIDDGKNPFVLTIYSSLGNNTLTYAQRLAVFHAIVITVENAQGIDTTSVLSSLSPSSSVTTQPALSQQ